MNTLFFITHKTLDENHADMVFRSISLQVTDRKFDRMIIYNTHAQELSNEHLVSLFHRHGLGRVISDVSVFDYDDRTGKSLGADIHCIREHCKATMNQNDRVLFLKSDCCLSRNYFDVILKIEEPRLVHFVAPFVCAKKRVADAEILKYLSRDLFIRSDEITFFVEDSNQSADNDFNKRSESITDQSILYTACTVTRDFSCHFVSVGLMDLIAIREQSWGGCNFSALDSYLQQSDRCFVVHKYHDIQSENRIGDREGPVKDWLNS
jgi:hypothetical protein